MKYNAKNKKTAAYQVGVQGYAFMNDRAFCNCQKTKLASSDSPHDAWFNCWKEYKDAYNSDPDKWVEKYLPLESSELSAVSSNIKGIIKNNLVLEVDATTAGSKLVGAAIRNQLREYAKVELKEKIEKH